jgi:hypothetical protein
VLRGENLTNVTVVTCNPGGTIDIARRGRSGRACGSRCNPAARALTKVQYRSECAMQ